MPTFEIQYATTAEQSLYSQISHLEPYSGCPAWSDGIDIVDNVGDIYFLLDGEYEIVEE